MTPFNGNANYETWCVSLWLDNEQGAYYDMISLARDNRDSDDAVIDLADRIKQYVENLVPNIGVSMFSDLLNSALGEVDWREIAQGYLEELSEEDEFSEEDQDDTNGQDDDLSDLELMNMGVSTSEAVANFIQAKHPDTPRWLAEQQAESIIPDDPEATPDLESKRTQGEIE